MELKKYRLGDIAEIIGGVSYSPKDICTGGIRILRGGNIQNQHIELKTDDVFLPISYKNNISQIYVGDTILVASTGSVDVLGKAATCFQYTEDVQIGAFLRIIRPKADKYTMLISSALSSDYFKRYIKAQAKGTSINNITLGYLRDFEIYAPHDFTGLSHLSANIENKICLNRAINDNLEAMAKQLYDYWFVQFDFPNEEGKPYKSSGGAMVWNEKLKREIPQGWSVLSVNDIAASVRGVSYAKDDMVDSNNGVLVLRGNNIQDNHLIYDSNVAYIPSSFVSENQRIRPLDIIMTMSSGSKEHIGKSAMFQFASEDTFGAFLTKFTAKEHCAYLLFNLFNSKYFKAKIKSIACGTGINNLTNQTFDEIYVVMPEDELLLKFDKRQSQIFAEIGLIEKSNIELTRQQDELLPLLMNGQATVNYHLSDD